MDGAARWLADRPVAVQRGLVLAAAAGCLLVAGLLDRFGPGVVATLGGTCTGTALFGVAGVAWRTFLPAATRRRWDVKARYPVAVRRWLAAAATVGWLTVLLLAGPVLSYPVGGTLFVAVGWGMFAFVRPSPGETRAAEQ